MLTLRESVRVLVGLYRIRIREDRIRIIDNMLLGVVMPVAAYWVAARHATTSTRPRLLLGAVTIGALGVIARHITLRITADRVFGTSALLATTRAGRTSYLAAFALEGFTLAMVPLLVLPLGTMTGSVGPVAYVWLGPYLLLVWSCVAMGVCCGSFTESMASAGLFANAAVLIQVAVCPLMYAADTSDGSSLAAAYQLPAALALDGMNGGWVNGDVSARVWCWLFGWNVLLTYVALRVCPWPGASERRR